MLYISDTESVTIVVIPTCETLVVDSTMPQVCLTLTNMTTHTVATYMLTPSAVGQCSVTVTVPQQERGQYNFTLVHGGDVVAKGLMQCGDVADGEVVEYNARTNNVTVYEYEPNIDPDPDDE